MASESDLPGQVKKQNIKLSMDRISSLPDELLINILNFLPTKYAFITSILSRRWSHLFKEVNNVDFDDSLPFNSRRAFNHKNGRVAFQAFMCNMMDCIKLSNLKRFRMICAEYHGQCFAGKVESWLLAILSHGIKEIDLCFDKSFKLPDVIFNCKTLRVLKLTTRNMLDLPDTVCLPCLKILHLRRVTLKEASVNKIIACCPLIHDFCMESFFVRGDGQLSISVPSLTKLKLENSRLFINYQPRPLVAIVAPRLQYFHYGDHLAKSYSITTSSYLVEAHLDISRNKDFEDVSAISHSAHSLIQGVSSVKRLFLSAGCMEALTYVKDELPILRNLTKLELGCSTILHVMLPRLLESAPYLEDLIFTEGLFPVNFMEQDVFRQGHWGRLEDVPSCLKTQVKVIEIQHFLGFAEELRMVGFFLSNSLSLAHVIIHKWVGTNQRYKVRNVRKQLERMAWRSRKCVHFCDRLL